MAIVSASLPLGIVAQRRPGVTRWAKWAWRITSVIPGAAAADWKLLRRDGDICEYHVATLPLELWSSDTGAYLSGLSARAPGVVVVMQADERPDAPMPWEPLLVTASPYDGQDYMDSGEGLIEQVPMPEGLVAWVRDFCDQHHVEEAFVKRRRDRARVDLVEDGKGDPRIRQASDVFRAPRRKEVLQ